MPKVKHDLKAQVEALGADSLLPPKKLTKKQFEEFENLVEDVSSRVNATRVMARLRMRAFVAKHGKEACDLAFKKIK